MCSKWEEIRGRSVASVPRCLSNSPELGRVSGLGLPEENERTAIREVFYGSLRTIVSGLARGGLNRCSWVLKPVPRGDREHFRQRDAILADDDRPLWRVPTLKLCEAAKPIAS